jgi:tRNA dimethylallyltransferase
LTAKPPRILCIIGPTASGKSALAMALAQRWDAELLSVDSMQVYRGMDVGTAKPSIDEQRAVKHHLIDVVDPHQEFTAARFVELADEVIRTSRKPLIAVGGTPLYYKTLFEGLFEGPGADAALRARLDAERLEVLYERLKRVDPEATTRIHLNDRKRIVRALEVFELTGKPITQHQREWGVQVRHRATWVGLNWEKDALNRRINARVKGMMQQGWLEECARLIDRPVSKTAGEATGYFELFQHLRGKMPLDDAVEQIKIATRQLARKQMKWFRRFEGTTWLAGEASVEEQVSMVERRLVPSPGTSGEG